jgi:DNA-binding response OmpR family regulator
LRIKPILKFAIALIFRYIPVRTSNFSVFKNKTVSFTGFYRMNPRAKTRILCVEDDPDTAELLVLTLGLEGYEVVETRSMTGAVLLVSNKHFDLCVLDSQLADGSGIDLCRFIKSKNESIPVVFFSASAFASNIAEAYRAGADEYLTKPSGWEKLADTINRLLLLNEHNLTNE